MSLKASLLSSSQSESDALTLRPDGARTFPLTILYSVSAITIFAAVTWYSEPAILAGVFLQAQQCSERGSSPCIRDRHLGVHRGDVSKDGFARKDENLVFVDSFSEARLDTSVWNLTRSLWGDGNDCFEYYTGDSDNLYINASDQTLRIKPGLFQDLGMVETEAGLQNAKNVMMGTCTPYPACATFTVPNCTESNLYGCRKVAGRPSGAIINPVTSARLTTEGTFEFVYGRLEVELRMPAADWLWPALWMFPSDQAYGPWPDSGEIDILETHGNPAGFLKSGQPSGRDRFASTLHYMGNAWWAAQGEAVADKSQVDWSARFFTVGLFWSEDEMYTYVRDDHTDQERVILNVSRLRRSSGSAFFDAPYGASSNPPLRPAMKGQLTRIATDPETQPYRGASSNAPFDQPFFLIMNIAVGGGKNECPVPDYWGENAIWCRCYPHCEASSKTEFWKRFDDWYPSWEQAAKSDRLSMAVRSVKVWQ